MFTDPEDRDGFSEKIQPLTWPLPTRPYTQKFPDVL